MVRKRYRPFTDGGVRLALAAVLAALVMLCPCGVRADSFDDDGLLRLINRWELMPKDYAPDDLILPEVPTNKESQKESIYMRPAAAAALEEMFAAAEEAGYHLLAVSGYRSYGTQSLLFKNKVNSTGSVERAQKTVAPAGASEHQSGLAMDVVSSNFRYLNRLFLQTDDFRVSFQKTADPFTGEIPVQSVQHQAFSALRFPADRGSNGFTGRHTDVPAGGQLRKSFSRFGAEEGIQRAGAKSRSDIFCGQPSGKADFHNPADYGGFRFLSA